MILIPKETEIITENLEEGSHGTMAFRPLVLIPETDEDRKEIDDLIERHTPTVSKEDIDFEEEEE